MKNSILTQDKDYTITFNFKESFYSGKVYEIEFINNLGNSILKLCLSKEDLYKTIDNFEFFNMSLHDVAFSLIDNHLNDILVQLFIDINEYNNFNEYFGYNNRVYLKISKFHEDIVLPVMRIEITDNWNDIIENLYKLQI